MNARRPVIHTIPAGTRQRITYPGQIIYPSHSNTWEENAFDWQHECELLRQQMARIEKVLDLDDAAMDPKQKLDLIDALTDVPCSHRAETPKP